MILRIRKMQKFWVLTAILIAVMLLFIPAIAFAESDDSDTADSTSDSVEPTVSDSSDSEEPSDSDDSTTELSSTDDEGDNSDTADSTSDSAEPTVSDSSDSEETSNSDNSSTDDGVDDSGTADSTSDSVEPTVSDSSDSEETSDSDDSTTELSSTDDEGDNSDTADSTSDSAEPTVSDSSDSEETSGSDDSTAGLNSTDDDETEEVAFSDEDDPLALDDGSTEISGGGGNSYTAEITPDSELGLNEPTDFTVTFTEVGDTDPLGSAQIIIPDEFTSISLGEITAPEGKNWSRGLVGQVISLWADNDVDYLTEGESVSAEFTATTSADPGDYTFHTLAWTDSEGYLFEDTGDPEKVDLGTAESFAILAASAITVAGEEDSTTVYGDIGMHPSGSTSYTGDENVVQTGGDVYMADGVAQKAQEDLQTAYTDAEGREDATVIGTELGGQILTPGVYTSVEGAAGTFGLTGTLTLDAQGNPNNAFIFQMGSTLITEGASSIELINGATFCQVFWQVGSSATLGSGSLFVGHILASDSITVGTNTTVIGQLLALNGAVTLDGSNTITNDPCEANVNAPAAGYDETMLVTVGTDTGTETGTGIIGGDDTTVLGSETVSETDGDSDVLSGDTAALPATGGLALAQVLYALGGVMMTVGGVMLKRSVK